MTVVSEEIVKCCCDGGGGGTVEEGCITLYGDGYLLGTYTLEFTYHLEWINGSTGNRTTYEVNFTFPVNYSFCTDFGGGSSNCTWQQSFTLTDFVGSAFYELVDSGGVVLQSRSATYPDDFEGLFPLDCTFLCRYNATTPEPTEWDLSFDMANTLPTPDPGSIPVEANDWRVVFDMPASFHPYGTWNPTPDDVLWAQTSDTVAEFMRNGGHSLVGWSAEVIVS